MNSSGKCPFMSFSSLPLSLVQFCHLSLCWQATACTRTYSPLVGIAPLPVLFQLGSMSAASVRSALCRLETHLWSAAPESSSARTTWKHGPLSKCSSEWRLLKRTVWGNVWKIPRAVGQRSEKLLRPALMMMMMPYVLMLNRHCNFLFECAQRMLRRDAVYIEFLFVVFLSIIFYLICDPGPQNQS